MEKLTRIGFQPAGQWLLADDRLALELTGVSEQKNVLYAFVRDGDVQYVGKTTKTLRRRMMGYLRPSSTQKTNTRNHKKIVELLRKGQDVYIFAWVDHGLHRYGDFTINLAAALEDSIIETLAPPWNGRCDERVVELSEESDPPDDSDEAKMEVEAIDATESVFPSKSGKPIRKRILQRPRQPRRRLRTGQIASQYLLRQGSNAGPSMGQPARRVEGNVSNHGRSCVARLVSSQLARGRLDHRQGSFAIGDPHRMSNELRGDSLSARGNPDPSFPFANQLSR